MACTVNAQLVAIVGVPVISPVELTVNPQSDARVVKVIGDCPPDAVNWYLYGCPTKPDGIFWSVNESGVHCADEAVIVKGALL